jgi:hypothetical protein
VVYPTDTYERLGKTSLMPACTWCMDEIGHDWYIIFAVVGLSLVGDCFACG